MSLVGGELNAELDDHLDCDKHEKSNRPNRCAFLILLVISCPILIVNRLSNPIGLLNHYTVINVCTNTGRIFQALQ
jgi:hypothetical protein